VGTGIFDTRMLTGLHSVMVIEFLPHIGVDYFQILWRHWCVSKTGYGPT